MTITKSQLKIQTQIINVLLSFIADLYSWFLKYISILAIIIVAFVCCLFLHLWCVLYLHLHRFQRRYVCAAHMTVISTAVVRA